MPATGLGLATLRSWPELESRVRGLTCATQAPLTYSSKNFIGSLIPEFKEASWVSPHLSEAVFFSHFLLDFRNGWDWSRFFCRQVSSLKGRSQRSKWGVLLSPALGLLCRRGAINNQLPVGRSRSKRCQNDDSWIWVESWPPCYKLRGLLQPSKAGWL